MIASAIVTSLLAIAMMTSLCRFATLFKTFCDQFENGVVAGGRKWGLKQHMS